MSEQPFNRALKILFLEDVAEDAELVARVLKKEGLRFELVRVDTKEEFFQAIRSHSFDVILSDHSLPQFNSSEALKLCRRLGISIPFILVTGSVSDEFAITKLKEGVDDYILKSSLQRLPTAITNSLTQRKLQSQRLEAELALRGQNEELLKINQELDSFVYSVSHDLRAPLLSILGLLNISRMDERPRDPVYDEYFNMMEKSIKKLDGTLKEILAYSRNARSEVTPTQVDFMLVLKSCMQKIEFLDGFSDMDIKIECRSMHSPFFSDGHRLSVVCENLLSNAIKYRNPKRKSLLFITLNVNENEARIKFEDNGIGIDEKLLPNVFKMFFRGTEQSDGAGLGLYLVKETLQKLKGTIHATSTFGVGSTFELTIPNLGELK
ncbi:MAG TPA: hybrid sensor histidine kinase/response regulator [Cytophagales bacterium]|nr:hybrid sensor histidine kinase/response regulator [Cytophagales bacterium]